MGQLWQVPTFLIGLAALVSVAATMPLRRDPAVQAFEENLQALCEGLREEQDPGTLISRAESVLPWAERLPRKAAEIHFLAGSVYCRQAKEIGSEHARDWYEKAREHLEQALALGIGAHEKHILEYRLGWSLYHLGMELPHAAELLARALEVGVEDAAPGYEVLVRAYLDLPRPSLDKALAANQKQIEHLFGDDAALAQAHLERGEILLKKERRLEAIKALDRVGGTAPREVRLKARLLQARCAEEEEWWSRAAGLWKELLADAGAVPGGKARILYALGVCHRNSEPPDREAAAQAWQEAAHLGGEAGQAAGLRLGELRLWGPAADTTQAFVVWSEALAGVHYSEDYRNSYVSLAKARGLLESACRSFREEQDYPRLQKFAELYKKLAAPGVAEESVAQATEALAREMEARAAPMSAAQAAPNQEEIRGKFRQAGALYEKAAEARPANQRAASLWQSAQCYLPAKEYSLAILVLEKFVHLETDEDRLAEAWLTMAEAHHALGHKERAQAAFYKCIEYPNTAYAYRARYQLALVEMEHNRVEQAEAILRQNLNSRGQALDREAHEQSLYKLAALLYQVQNFDQAGLYLKEASRQYPNNPQVFTVRDQLGECYKKLAEQAKKKMEEGSGSELQGHHRRNRQLWLEQGALTYQHLADDLEARGKHKSLAPTELGLLRKALFGAADLRLEMNETAEALRRYRILQERYRKQVEGLIACQRIWRCTRLMKDSPDQEKLGRVAVEEAVAAAKADLEGMPEDSDAFRGGPGVWRRVDWQNWLRWVQQQLTPPATSERPGTLFQ